MVGGEVTRCRACGLADIIREAGVQAEHLDPRDPTAHIPFIRGNLLDLEPLTIVEAWCERVDVSVAGNIGLYFHGGNGFGKSAMAARCVIAAIRAGYDARFATATAILDGIKAEFGKGGGEGYMERLVALDVLAVDDLGAEYDTPWAVSRLFDLLNARLARKAPTIVTSNDPPHKAIALPEDEWAARRIASRLAGASVVLEVRARGDYRRGQGRSKLRGLFPEEAEETPTGREGLHPQHQGDTE